MHSEPAPASLGTRDVAAAWLLCLAIAAFAIASPTIAAAPHGIAGATRAGLGALRHAASTLLCTDGRPRAARPAA